MHRIAKRVRLCSNYTYTQTDFTKRIGLIRGSKVLERGHSVAAPNVSDEIKTRKTGKRLSKDERRAMVESYVIKYKETNHGKLPSSSETKKQVGGGYYVIRNILQEMKHRTKAPPLNTQLENVLRKEANDAAAVTTNHPTRKTLSEKVVIPKKPVDVDDVNSAYSDIKNASAEEEPKDSTLLRTTFFDEVVKPTTTGDVLDHSDSSTSAEEKFKASIEEAVNLKKTVDGDDADNSSKGVAVEEESKYSTLFVKVFKPMATDDSSSYIESQKNELKVDTEAEEVVHLHSERREHDGKDIVTSEGTPTKNQQHTASPGSDEVTVGNSEEKNNHEELRKQQSVWGNLKSFVDEFIKIWKGS